MKTDAMKLHSDESSDSYSSKNAKSKAGVEGAFFECLSKSHIGPLEKLCYYDYEHGRTFYAVFSGSRTAEKLAGLNNAMTYAMSHMKFKKDGSPYQPNTMSTMLKMLFATFRSKGIEYSHLSDFNYDNGNGDMGFARRLSHFWTTTFAKDVTFGTRPTRRNLPANYGEEIRRLFNSSAMLPLNPHHVENVLLAFAFTLGTMFGARGNAEIYQSQFSHFERVTFPLDHPDFPGGKALIKHATITKTRTISLTNPQLCEESQRQVIVDNSDDPFSPGLLFDQLLCFKHSQQRFIFHHAASPELIAEYRSKGEPHALMNLQKRMTPATVRQVRLGFFISCSHLIFVSHDVLFFLPVHSCSPRKIGLSR